MDKIVEKKAPVSWVRIILAFINYFGGYLYAYPFIITKIALLLTGSEYSGPVGLFICIMIPLVITIVLLWPLLKESLSNFKNNLWKNISNTLKGLLAIFVGEIILSIIISVLIGIETTENQETINEIYQNYPMLMTFMACVFAPIVEELLFRGILFRALRPHLDLTVCLVITGLCFGFIHVMDAVFAGNFMELGYIVVYGYLGAVLAMEYEVNQNIYSCMLLHAIYNFIALMVIG